MMNCSPFRYPGGKSRLSIAQLILGHAPAAYTEYAEPFVGGGGVFFAIPSHIDRWINDRHPGLVAVYLALRDRPEQFIRRCREIPAAESHQRGWARRKSYDDDHLRRVFEQFRDRDCDDAALRYLFLNRTSILGRVNYAHRTRMYFSNPAGWNIIRTRRLEAAAARLKGTRITCGDFEPLFEGSAVGTRWIYADPPYWSDTRASRTAKLYEHSFTVDDHERLADCVRRCQHQVLLSYDDAPEIRHLYRGFKIVPVQWTYVGALGSRRRGSELLIANYDFPALGRWDESKSNRQTVAVSGTRGSP